MNTTEYPQGLPLNHNDHLRCVRLAVQHGTTVQRLAHLLGVTPDEVRALAVEASVTLLEERPGQHSERKTTQ